MMKRDREWGSELSKLFICFVMYAIIGWVYEVFLEVVIYRWGFSNRGVLFGPYCPIYGVGAILFILLFNKYKKESKQNAIIKVILLFLGCMGIATLIELATTYILELTIGYWPWQTYSDYAIHFQGRIALSPSIRFGLSGILFLYVLQPLFERMLNKLKKKKIYIISILLAAILTVDIIYTLFL